MRTIRSLVAGTPAAGAPGGTLTIANPARLDDTVAEVALGDAATLVEACRTARESQRDWAATPAPTRGRVVQQFGRLVEDNFEALSALITREIGKPIRESRGEVQEVVDTCNFFLSEGRRLYGQTVPSEMPDKQLFTFRTPVGVAAIVTAGNFPVAVPSWYIVPALVCGNAVVWKPAEYTPATAEAFAQLLLHAGVPAGVFSMVLADGATTFDGTRAGARSAPRRQDRVHGLHRGRAAHRRARRTPPADAVPRARRQEPARRHARRRPRPRGRRRAVQRFRHGGPALHVARHGDRAQPTCTTTSSIGSRRRRRRRRSAIRPADVLYGPMISARFCERFEGWLELVQPHHEVLGSSGTGRITASNPREGFVGDPDAGLYYHPTIVDGVVPGDDLYSTETFGPIVGVATFETFDEAIALANGHGYGLSASIYTTDPLSVFRFRERIAAGMVSVNNSTSGAEAHLPFGGNGRSGNGSRQSGIWVLDQFTRWQAMNWDYSGHLQKAQMDVADVEADLSYRLPD